MIQIQWSIGALPLKEGWYIVAKSRFSSPTLMRFNIESHGSWDRVIAWSGPITIPMNEVSHAGNWCLNDGWYIVVKRGIPTPALMQFRNKCHDNWDRVVAWHGPIVIPMNEVKGITC